MTGLLDYDGGAAIRFTGFKDEQDLVVGTIPSPFFNQDLPDLGMNRIQLLVLSCLLSNSYLSTSYTPYPTSISINRMSHIPLHYAKTNCRY